MTDKISDIAGARYQRATERVALLTALANRSTADPGRVLADLEVAVKEQQATLEGLLLSDEMQLELRNPISK